MKSLAEQLSLYVQYHKNPVNKVSHFVGVPLLLFAAMIFLGWIHLSVPNLFEINFAWLAVLALLIYYFTLDFWLAAGLTVILFLLTFISEFFSQPIMTKFGVVVFLVCLILGVIAQLVGHFYEKKKPAFLDSWQQILIAPLFLFAELMFELGYRKDLQEKITKNENKEFE
jgi:uncharacterized membrane protein YGL010W